MKRKHDYRPQLDYLENRLALAGNVTAAGGAVLELRGDAAGNQVRITQGDGRILVEGLNGTTINGRASQAFAAGIEKLDVLLFGGDDTLILRKLRATTDFNVEMDLGNDVVKMEQTRTGVNVTVKMDDGDDRFHATGVRAGSDLNVEMGQGNSSVKVSSATVGGTLNILTLDGVDVVDVDSSSISKDLKVNVGKGNDEASISDVTVGLAATIITDLGNDRARAWRLTTNEDLNVEVGEGADRVQLTDVRSRKNVKVDAQTGRDFVGVRGVVAAKDAVFLGGDEIDTFENRGVRGGEKLEIKEFERFV